MSAFVVSDKTIDRFLTAVEKVREIKEDELQKLGQQLLEMNIDAVNYRYDDEIPYRKYQFHRSGRFHKLQEILLDGYAAGRCIRYQCMEGTIENRPLFKKLSKILDDIAHEYITNLPEYEKMEWD
jgi:hypothetical protein